MNYFKWQDRDFKEYTIPSELFITKSWFDKDLNDCHLVLESEEHLLKVVMRNGISTSGVIATYYAIVHDVNFIEMPLDRYNRIKAFL